MAMLLLRLYGRSTRFKVKFSLRTLIVLESCLIENLEVDKGEIFSCGYNRAGQCGLGHFNNPQITPSLIPNAEVTTKTSAKNDCSKIF